MDVEKECAEFNSICTTLQRCLSLFEFRNEAEPPPSSGLIRQGISPTYASMPRDRRWLIREKSTHSFCS
jgi:hypothetical protein